jgi:hypothetical protein
MKGWLDNSRNGLLILGVLVFAIGIALADLTLDKAPGSGNPPSIATPFLSIPPRERVRPSPPPYPAPDAALTLPPGEPYPPPDQEPGAR